MTSEASQAPEPNLPRLRAGDRRFAVALSFPGDLRETALAIAESLAAQLGKQRVFYDRYYEAELARPDSDTYLQTIYHDCSELIVVFLSRSYEQKDWCGLEWRAIRDLIKSRQADRIMLLRFDDAQVAGIFSTDITIDARAHSPEELSHKVLDRLAARPHDVPVASRDLARPGLLRHLLDRALPGLHLRLTRLGSFPEPREMADFHAFLGDLQAGIEHDVREKTYLPLDAKVVPRRAAPEAGGDDPFVRPVQQMIRQVLGLAEGGDSASAQIAAVNRRSRLVKNILKALLTAEDPLVLLGDPGSGKTMTLQQAAIALAGSELRRVFPTVPLYLRLGELHVEGEVGPEQIAAFVRRSAPPRLQPWLDALDRAGRLVLLFDGMDEMSRDRYNEHTAALSVFAGSRRGRTKTLFSCRITDFSPSFVHRRLVLLPFNRSQVTIYLHRYLQSRSVQIDGQTLSIPRLARLLSGGDLPVEPSNPFVLWLLCLFLQEQKTLPASRVELMDYYSRKSYERKRKDAEEEGALFPEPDEAFRAWARCAFTITERNRGAAIAVADLVEGLMDRPAVERVLQMIRIGKACGVLTESIEGTLHEIRFNHHRFQEYFTALYIQEANPPIDWLSRLDAPRWQETMVNLVLMGGAEEGVIALTDAITEPVQRHRPVFARYVEKRKKWEEKQRRRAEEEKDSESSAKLEKSQGRGPVAPKIQEESILADRVELGAKLIRHAERASPAVQERLKPALREAVDLLVEYGNPMTQVKMMRACQRSTDLDLLQVLAKPLRSPVRWVRDQALILVAASRPGSRGAGTDLATEMGFDLAASRFLPRWLAYLKAVLATRRAGAWWSFFLATWFSLLSLLACFAEGYLIYAGIRAGLEISAEPGTRNIETSLFLGQPGTQLFVAGLALGILCFFRYEFLWAGVPICTISAMVVALMGELFSHGQLSAVLLPILALLLGAILYYLAALPFALIHSSLLILYLALTRGTRARGQTLSSFLSFAWRETGLEEPAGTVLSTIGGFSGLLAIGVLLIAAGLLAVDSPRLFLALLLLALALLGLLAARTTRGRLLSAQAWTWLESETAAIRAHLSARGFLKMLGWSLASLFLFLLAILVVAVGEPVIVRVKQVAEDARPHLDRLSTVLSYILLLVVAGALALLAFGLVYWLIQRLRAALPRAPYRPGSFTPERWKELLRDSPGRQVELLSRTDHQSLGLRPEEHLELLREVEGLFRHEPALSVYWERRDQLEQVLKQERQG